MCAPKGQLAQTIARPSSTTLTTSGPEKDKTRKKDKPFARLESKDPDIFALKPKVRSTERVCEHGGACKGPAWCECRTHHVGWIVSLRLLWRPAEWL